RRRREAARVMTGSLASVFAAAVFFVASHILLSDAALRTTLVERLGAVGFRALYSVVALAALVWLVMAYGRAPYIELWPQVTWARHLALVVMPIAVILVVCGVTTRNPLAVGGDAFAQSVEPMPGILKLTRHPVLWGTGLWALVHILANGDAASLIMFGSFAVLSFAGMAHIDRRRAKTLGAAWGPIALTTSAVPFAAILAGRAKLEFAQIGAWRILAGIAVYLAFLIAHEWVIGVSALPG
ncbi:MAG: NnrU family protein, partial [Proteobacteria bacterium]|nr:NnrU family protein [Pseudomonadota bacterium]